MALESLLIADGRLRLVKTITGDISPKSVASNGHGLVTAQNMMYTHTITVYDARSMKLKATIPDAVRLSRFGVKGHPGVSRGAPVEAAFSPGGLYAYVTNYAMYGRGFGPEGKDTCTPAWRSVSSFQSWSRSATRSMGERPRSTISTPSGLWLDKRIASSSSGL